MLSSFSVLIVSFAEPVYRNPRPVGLLQSVAAGLDIYRIPIPLIAAQFQLRLNVPIVIARSEMTKQSFFAFRIKAGLLRCARNDKLRIGLFTRYPTAGIISRL